jgi:VanZ family protein
MSIVLKRIIFFSYLLLLIFAAVFPFTSTNVADMNNTYVMSFRLDHLLHVLAFLPLYALAYWTLKPLKRKQHFVLLVIGLFLASSIEFLHFFLDYRAFNSTDLIANLSGVLLGATIMLVVKNKKI